MVEMSDSETGNDITPMLESLMAATNVSDVNFNVRHDSRVRADVFHRFIDAGGNVIMHGYRLEVEGDLELADVEKMGVESSAQWTTTPPTVPGLYWARCSASHMDTGKVEPVGVFRRPDGGMRCQALDGTSAFEVRGDSGWDLWSGPINPPPLPEE